MIHVKTLVIAAAIFFVLVALAAVNVWLNSSWPAHPWLIRIGI